VSRKEFAHQFGSRSRDGNEGEQKEKKRRFVTVEHRAGRKAKIQPNGGNLRVEKGQFLTGKRKGNQ
jgi:hypothetical protein